MTEKERARKIKKAAEYSAKATMDFLSSEKMKEIFINFYTNIYSEAPEDVLENIYNAVGTKKAYIKVSKATCENKASYDALVDVLDTNEPLFLEYFGIDV